MQSAGQARRGSGAQEQIFKRAATTAVYAALGLLTSRGAVLGNLAPFGVSFAAAVPRRYVIPSLLGAALGYVLLLPTDSFRYLAAVAAVGAARWLLSDIKRIRRSRFFPPVTAFLAVGSTGAALLFGGSGEVDAAVTAFLEAALSGAAAYFMAESVRLYDERRSLAACSQQESASLVLTACVLMLSLSGAALEGVSLGRIVAVTAVLLCARYGGAGGGAVSGAATGRGVQPCRSEQRLSVRRLRLRRADGRAVLAAGQARLCAVIFAVKRRDDAQLRSAGSACGIADRKRGRRRGVPAAAKGAGSADHARVSQRGKRVLGRDSGGVISSHGSALPQKRSRK